MAPKSRAKKRRPRRGGKKFGTLRLLMIGVAVLVVIGLSLYGARDKIGAFVDEQISQIAEQVTSEIASHVTSSPPSGKAGGARSGADNTDDASSSKSTRANNTDDASSGRLRVEPAMTGNGDAVNTPSNSNPSDLPPLAQNEIRVHFIDLGQADAILIHSRDNAVLIDGGEYQTRARLLAYLRGAGITALDHVVATHPHSDHIGGLAPVLRSSITVRNVLMPDAVNNTSSFEHLLAAIEEKSIPASVPNVGDAVTAGIIRMTVLAPGEKMRGDRNLNNASIVLRMTHGGTAFMFTGDAESPSEREMVESGMNLRADVLKAGHHGSRTSTIPAFLDAVRPSIVVVMCGRGNRYGHPHREFLDLVTAPSRNITLLRTDELGTIVITTDGRNVTILRGGG